MTLTNAPSSRSIRAVIAFVATLAAGGTINTAKGGETQRDNVTSMTLAVSVNGCRDDLGKQMLAIVNQERTQRGLGTLRWSQEIADVGCEHSKDMDSRNFFDHVNPNGLSPSQRIEAAGIITPFGSGENLQAHNIPGTEAARVGAAHTALMDSKGHRENILRTAFTHAGIGIFEASSGMIITTQMFSIGEPYYESQNPPATVASTSPQQGTAASASTYEETDSQQIDTSSTTTTTGLTGTNSLSLLGSAPRLGEGSSGNSGVITMEELNKLREEAPRLGE